MSQNMKNPKIRNAFNLELRLDKHGSVVDMSEVTTGGQNILAFVTSRGHVCGLDLRAKELAWDLENDPKYGIDIYVIEKKFLIIIYRNYYHNYTDTIMYYCLFFRVDVIYDSFQC